jgi:ABC-type amino acid transport system permease subunit
VAEVLRGGLNSVHRGQREAALAAGLPPYKVFTNIVLPQALRVMLPPLLNCYVSLLKDSSLCALIATDELMLTARAMSSEYFLPLHIFVLVGLFYFAIAFPLSMFSRLLAKRLSRGRRALGWHDRCSKSNPTRLLKKRPPPSATARSRAKRLSITSWRASPGLTVS